MLCTLYPSTDDSFRSKFLWGRKPLLAACAARLRGIAADAKRTGAGLVWVDLGGGTGENVAMMAQYMDLSQFKHIYIVDLCASLCRQARQKVAEHGWRNVTVVEADACEFVPKEGTASLVTFSYSLSSKLVLALFVTTLKDGAILFNRF